MKTLFTALFAAALAAGCATSSTGPEDRADAVLDTPAEVVVTVGQERTVPGTQLRLRFVRLVEESRCPANAVCIWAGNAAVEVAIAQGSGTPETFVLHTTLEPHHAEKLGVLVTLLAVTPYPGTGDTSAYAVRLKVEDPARRASAS